MCKNLSLEGLKQRSPYMRHTIWYICFYIGLFVLGVFCFRYNFLNPDEDKCWYGCQPLPEVEADADPSVEVLADEAVVEA